jgi:hypothetical protein
MLPALPMRGESFSPGSESKSVTSAFPSLSTHLFDLLPNEQPVLFRSPAITNLGRLFSLSGSALISEFPRLATIGAIYLSAVKTSGCAPDAQINHAAKRSESYLSNGNRTSIQNGSMVDRKRGDS